MKTSLGGQRLVSALNSSAAKQFLNGMRNLLLVFLVLGAWSRCRAQGTLQIGFEGPPTIAPGAGIMTGSYYESGMWFRGVGPEEFERYGPDYPSDPQSGTSFVKTALGDSLMFSFTNGSSFGLVSVDLAEYSTVVPDPATVMFIGYFVGGGTVTNIFTTDGIIDGTGPLADFQTFYFTGFDNLSRVEVPDPVWALDNLVVAVPEPNTGALLLFGGVVCLMIRRERKGHQSVPS